MSVEPHRVEQEGKSLEVARFSRDTLVTAIQDGNVVCGFKRRPNIERSTHVLIEVNFGDGYKVVGDGWADGPASEDDNRFGEDFPYTVSLSEIRFITDPHNFISSPLKWPARTVSKDTDSDTFINAARTTVRLDYLWAEGMTAGVENVDDWGLYN